MNKIYKIVLAVVALLCFAFAVGCSNDNGEDANCDNGHNYANGECTVCGRIDGGDVEYVYDSNSKTYAVKGLIQGSTQVDITVLSEYNDGVNGKKDVTYVQQSAFSGNRFLTRVILPTSVTKLGAKAFEECRGLKVIDMRGVQTFEKQDTFLNNLSLEYVIISDSLNYDKRQFHTSDTAWQPKTEVLVWGSGLYISDFRLTFHPDVNRLLTGDVFYYTNDVQLSCGLWHYDTDGQIAISKHEYDGEVCTECGAIDPKDLVFLFDSTNSHYVLAGHRKGFNQSTFVVPETFDDGVHSFFDVSEVGARAFIGVGEIKRLILPTTMSYLGDCSFFGCYNLEFVDMGGMNYIGREPLQVFTECKKLTKLLVDSTFTMEDFNIVYFTFKTYENRSECRIMDFYVKAAKKEDCSVFLNHPMEQLHLNTSSNMFNEVYMYSETAKENTWHYDQEGVPTLWNS